MQINLRTTVSFMDLSTVYYLDRLIVSATIEDMKSLGTAKQQ